MPPFFIFLKNKNNLLTNLWFVDIYLLLAIINKNIFYEKV